MVSFDYLERQFGRYHQCHCHDANKKQGAPIAGYLLVAYGGEAEGFKAFRPAIYYAGSMTLAASGLVVFVRLKSTTKLTAKL